MKKLKKLLLLMGIILSASFVNAQVDFDAQILQRAEYRHGYGTLINSDVNPAFGILQRSRIGVNYKGDNDRLTMRISGQDIRLWGATGQVKMGDGFFSIHEAWGEYKLTDKLTARAGRQELVYDDHRILGNLDWLMQARAHDAAILKYTEETWAVHLGAAYNQDQFGASGNLFTLNNYKAAQYLWAEKKSKKFSIGFLAWNNGMQFVETDDAGVTNESIKYAQTIGIPKINYKAGNLEFNSFYYHQIGKDQLNRDVNAFDASAEVSYKITLNDSVNNQLMFTLGGEMLSGTSQVNQPDNTNNSFDPLYGTPHRFNGYMDYFYVGGRHLNSVGLIDGFFKVKYNFNPKYWINVNTHYFMAAADVLDPTEIDPTAADSFLGIEVDFTLGMVLNPSFSIQAGYSQMFASETMEYLRGGDRNAINNWGYVMLVYRPHSKAKFIGLKF
jgi:hypothetical protein